jgi:hypothetical protein
MIEPYEFFSEHPRGGGIRGPLPGSVSKCRADKTKYRLFVLARQSASVYPPHIRHGFTVIFSKGKI